MKKEKFTAFDVGVLIISAIITILIFIPLLYVLANAFSDPVLVYSGKVGIIPQRFTFKNIADVFSDSQILRGFLNTLYYTAVGTVIQVVLQFLVGYALSRRDLKFKKFFNMFFAIPMFISGGMIPTYLIVKSLGMLNTAWALIIPGCLGLYKGRTFKDDKLVIKIDGRQKTIFSCNTIKKEDAEKLRLKIF